MIISHLGRLTVLFCCLRGVNAMNITVLWTAGYSCLLEFNGSTVPCSLGKNGVTEYKREGDGCTPTGTFILRRGFYRSDKVSLELSKFSRSFFTETRPEFGWCDDPLSELYNQFLNSVPITASYENLWLESSPVYDLLGVIGYNDDPPVPYLGSAIFFHVTETYGPTAGCVAIAMKDLQWILQNIKEDTRMIIRQA